MTHRLERRLPPVHLAQLTVVRRAVARVSDGLVAVSVNSAPAGGGPQPLRSRLREHPFKQKQPDPGNVQSPGALFALAHIVSAFFAAATCQKSKVPAFAGVLAGRLLTTTVPPPTCRLTSWPLADIMTLGAGRVLGGALAGRPPGLVGQLRYLQRRSLHRIFVASWCTGHESAC